MSRRDDRISLQQMLDHAREVVELTSGKQLSNLEADRLLQLALIRLLEVIGESATRVSLETRAQLADVPWSQIISLRNRLIHGYDTVDLTIVWGILRDDVPRLVRDLNAALGYSED